MKKNIYLLDNIDCAACSIKIEDAIKNLNGVYSCSMNFLFYTFSVYFDENVVSDEEIETAIHKSLYKVKIVEKNNEYFEDNYEEENVLRNILFGRKRRNV